MAEKQNTERSEERRVQDLPEKELDAREQKEVRGGLGPVSGKKPPILPIGPVDGIK